MDNIKKALSSAIGRILDPLIHLLLQFDISHSEFAELARRSYVRVAFKHFAIPGRKKTNSRVAVITGLSRQEVVRLSQLAQDDLPQTKGPLNRATRVIGGWLHDLDFCDDKHNPKVLPLRDAPFSFDELVARYSGGITARAILDELIRVGAVAKVDKEQVQLLNQSYVPSNDKVELVDLVTTHTSDMLSTVIHNLSSAPEERRFQRQVTYRDIPEQYHQEFQQLCYEKSLAMLLELNHWLAEKKKIAQSEKKTTSTRIGLGIYYFKKELDEDDL